LAAGYPVCCRGSPCKVRGEVPALPGRRYRTTRRKMADSQPPCEADGVALEGPNSTFGQPRPRVFSCSPLVQPSTAREPRLGCTGESKSAWLVRWPRPLGPGSLSAEPRFPRPGVPEGVGPRVSETIVAGPGLWSGSEFLPRHDSWYKARLVAPGPCQGAVVAERPHSGARLVGL